MKFASHILVYSRAWYSYTWPYRAHESRIVTQCHMHTCNVSSHMRSQRHSHMITQRFWRVSKHENTCFTTCAYDNSISTITVNKLICIYAHIARYSMRVLVRVKCSHEHIMWKNYPWWSHDSSHGYVLHRALPCKATVRQLRQTWIALDSWWIIWTPKNDAKLSK
jgi:hypothetical protein